MPQELVEKIGKSFRLALDTAASHGEAENAAVKAVHILRSNKVTFDLLCRQIVHNAPLQDARVTFPFGKYEGWSIAEGFKHDADYLEWVRKKLTHERPHIVAAITQFFKQVPKRPEN